MEITCKSFKNPVNIEIMATNRIIYAQLLQEASKVKKVNLTRYALAISMLDEDGQGWVKTHVIEDILSDCFEVTKKTVRNNIYKCVEIGFGNLTKDGSTFYYRKQEKMAEALGFRITRRTSVEMSLEDLSGSVVDARAAFSDAVLSSLSKGEKKVTITRATRKKLTGRDRRTQRKYDKRRGVKTTSNFAVLDEFSEYNLQRALYKGKPAFVFTDFFNQLHAGPKAAFVVQQMANSYVGNFSVRKRRISNKLNFNEPLVSVEPVHLYFEDPIEAAERWTQDQLHDAFFPNDVGNDQFQLWNVLPASNTW